MTVAEARKILEDVEAEALLPQEMLAKEAVRIVSGGGVFEGIGGGWLVSTGGFGLGGICATRTWVIRAVHQAEARNILRRG